MNPFRRTLLAAALLASLSGVAVSAPASVEAPVAQEAVPEVAEEVETDKPAPKKSHRATEGSFDELKAR